MNKLFKTEPSHKKIEISPELANKLDNNTFSNRIKTNVIRGLSIASAMLVFLTSCSGTEKYNKEDFESQPTAYTEDMDKTINSSEDELSLLIDSSYYENYENYNEMDYKIEDNRECTYSALVNELQEELSKKDFPQTANEMYMQILDDIYKYYDEHQATSLDMPNKYEYIRSHLIDLIPQIENIKFHDRNSSESQELRNLGVYYANYNGKVIEFAYIPEKTYNYNYKFSPYDLSILLHETGRTCFSKRYSV